MVRIECKMVDIKESKHKFEYEINILGRKMSILPNPMAFANSCMTTDTVILIGYPNDKNYIKSYMNSNKNSIESLENHYELPVEASLKNSDIIASIPLE